MQWDREVYTEKTHLKVGVESNGTGKSTQKGLISKPMWNAVGQGSLHRKDLPQSLCGMQWDREVYTERTYLKAYVECSGTGKSTLKGFTSKPVWTAAGHS